MIIYSKTLKSLRDYSNLTQDEVARALGISRSAYAYYERGTTSPDFECLLKLCKLYNININDMTTLILKDNISITGFKSDDIHPLLISFLSDVDNLNIEEDEKMVLLLYRRLPDSLKDRFFIEIKKSFDDLIGTFDGDWASETKIRNLMSEGYPQKHPLGDTEDFLNGLRWEDVE